MIKRRVSVKELSQEWKITPNRVLAICRKAGIEQFSDRTFDYAAASEARRLQIIKNPMRTLGMRVANQHSSQGPKIAQVRAAGMDLPTATDAETAARHIQALKLEEIEQRVERLQTQNAAVESRFMSVEEVRSQVSTVGDLLDAMLEKLPVKIAAECRGPDLKREARQMAQAVAEQIRHIFQSKTSKYREI